MKNSFELSFLATSDKPKEMLKNILLNYNDKVVSQKPNMVEDRPK